MDDATEILAEMVAARYPPLAGNAISYDVDPPDEVDIYGIINIQEGDPIPFIIQGGGAGRWQIDWTLRVIGLRESVAEAVRELTQAINNPYHDSAREVTVMWTLVQRVSGIMRPPQDRGNAAQILRLTSEMVQI